MRTISRVVWRHVQVETYSFCIFIVISFIVILLNYFALILTVLCRCPQEVVTGPWRCRRVEAAAGHITGWQGNDYIHISRTTADCYLCTYSYIVLLPCHVRLLVSTHPATYTDRPMRRRKVKLCV